ncbi:MAG TPA: hypothetical protein VFW07_24285 [Parafilimonas sp.]|nr:hypothetical protein [Parafilimonas sp.]
MSKIYSFKAIQIIPAGLEAVWNFFSDPENLAVITPKQLDFKITGLHHKIMHTGQVIEYTIKPLFGIPVYRMTEITHVQYKKYLHRKYDNIILTLHECGVN